MANLNYEQLAVAALDALLAGGLEITQHYYNPDPNEWYFKGPMGKVGPFETPETAVKAAIQALYSQLAQQPSAPGSTRRMVAMGWRRGDGPLMTLIWQASEAKLPYNDTILGVL